MYRQKTWVLAFLLLFAAGAVPAAAADGPFQFFPLTPCRTVDTRQLPPGPPTGDPLEAYTVTTFDVKGFCDVPLSAKAVAVNVTAFQPTAKGHLRVYPSDIGTPLVATLTYAGGETAIANGAIVPLAATTTDDLAVYTYFVAGGNQTHFILDVTGYFQ